MPKSSVDYATDNITVYRSPCPYRCRYCWAWRIPLFRSRIRRGHYDPVKEAERYARTGEPRTIVVSFTSDPYPPVEKSLRKTRRVLEALARNPRHKVMVLTKNPQLALRDLDIFLRHPNMWLGTTVISLEPTDWEPYAPSPEERLSALKSAHSKGVRTWLSVEPIIPRTTYPELIVGETLDYVDWYVLGAFNYSGRLAKMGKDVLKGWYRDHVVQAISILRSHGREFHIKKELRKYL
ncbi:MAG: hypothetical protein DRO12_01065 [Thermoprotei archaeon]|nr:MAG: hypothetical protein DRO12_01065 [Thermoprotei archaeon]